MTSLSETKAYDNHTLFIKCDCATVEQIRTAFRESLTTYQTSIGKHLECRFRVNLVENREGNSFGIAFVFVTNPAVYHMLMGKNPDGSDRIKYIDDPSWVAPTDTELTNDSGWSAISEPVFVPDMNWSDEMELEEEYKRQLYEKETRDICPKITSQLDPLMVLPPFKLTQEQMEKKRAKISADNQGKPNFDPKLIEIPELAYFGVDRAMVMPTDPMYMPNILRCKSVPLWVNNDDLKIQFAPYANDSKTFQDRLVKGRHTDETYPFVNINQDRIAFVIFDPSTHDAQFALHMMRKTVINKKAEDGSLLTVTLLFQHSFKTDRDLMADIGQQPRPVNRRDMPRELNKRDMPRELNKRDVPRELNKSWYNSRDSVSSGKNSHGENNADKKSAPNTASYNVRKVAANAIPQSRKPAQSSRGNLFASLGKEDI